jgi:hypothetical protein
MLCSSCSGKGATAQLELTGYNHTSKSIGSYSVDIPGGEGTGAGFLASGEGGGGSTCCLTIPKQWAAGYFITVRWKSYAGEIERECSTTVPIPRYDIDNSRLLNVHFLRNGKVVAFVTRLSLRHADYPLKGKDAEMPPHQFLSKHQPDPGK